MIITGRCKECRGKFALTKKSMIRTHYKGKFKLPCWGSLKLPDKLYITSDGSETEANVTDPKLKSVVLSSKFMLWATMKGINYEEAVVLRDGYNLAKENGLKSVSYEQLLIENALTLATKGAWNRSG